MKQKTQSSGILLVDKPVQCTSFDVIRQARKKLNTKKIGHAGTLDPFATGLMVLGIGEGTKVLSELLLNTKAYQAHIYLGATSSTGDPEGKIISSYSGKPFSEEQIEHCRQHFIGEIIQTPPIYSALKIAGKRACDRVRAGEDILQYIKKKTRQVQIYSLEILRYQFPELVVQVQCSSGTYIRTLAEDIGKYLECGAYLTQLRRTQVGNFVLSHASTIQEIDPHKVQMLTPDCFDIPLLEILEQQYKDIVQGKKVSTNFTQSYPKASVWYQQQLAAFGEVQKEAEQYVFQPRKVFHIS